MYIYDLFLIYNSEHPAKFSLYSAHDSTLLALFAALQLPPRFSAQIPPYGLSLGKFSWQAALFLYRALATQ